MKKFLLTLVTSCSLALAFMIASSASAGSSDEAQVTPAAEDGKIAVTFKYEPTRREKNTLEEVTVAGEFNNWDGFATPMTKGEDGDWSVTVHLAPGTYQWKFLRNGTWIQSMETVADQISPTPDRYVSDPYGGKNAENTFKK